MNAETVLARLYETRFGSAPAKVEKLAGAGSNRSYYRLTGQGAGKDVTVIGTTGTDLAENKAFIALSRHLSGKGLPVPEVFAVSDDGMAYLQEDLGDVSLFDAIASGRDSGSFSDHEEALVESVIRLLPAIQFRGAEGMDYSCCYPYPELDSRTISGDLNYFKYDFLKPSGIEFSEKLLDDELELLHNKILYFCRRNVGFMVRDFQSCNVMLSGDTPCLIDFQGGRRGPAAYDVVSFLWQAKANFPESL
ncbi:MAG: phosphotransferase, partial [Muribaculaceae bacterium]|nr:phosphotransferase [Muribaculaceae bacterium]